MALGLLAVLAFLAAGLAYATVAKSRWGINLSPPKTCTQCGEKIPLLRRPADAHESAWGGWTCKNCGHKIDKWGNSRD